MTDLFSEIRLYVRVINFVVTQHGNGSTDSGITSAGGALKAVYLNGKLTAVSGDNALEESQFLRQACLGKVACGDEGINSADLLHCGVSVVQLIHGIGVGKVDIAAYNEAGYNVTALFDGGDFGGS